MKRIKEINDINILEEIKTFPNQAIIWSLINGLNQGELWQSNNNKAVILLEKGDYPFVFMAGELDDDTLIEAKKFLKNNSMVYCDPYYHKWFFDMGYKILCRVQMLYSTPNLIPLMPNCSIIPIDNINILKQCYWHDVAAKHYGSLKLFLQHGKGYALLNEENKIISEAYIDYTGGGYAEIGITTHPSYRQKGAASSLASYLVEDCIRNNLTPIWSADTGNLASIKTALNIGFRIERYYVHMLAKDFGT